MESKYLIPHLNSICCFKPERRASIEIDSSPHTIRASAHPTEKQVESEVSFNFKFTPLSFYGMVSSEKGYYYLSPSLPLQGLNLNVSLFKSFPSSLEYSKRFPIMKEDATKDSPKIDFDVFSKISHLNFQYDFEAKGMLECIYHNVRLQLRAIYPQFGAFNIKVLTALSLNKSALELNANLMKPSFSLSGTTSIKSFPIAAKVRYSPSSGLSGVVGGKIYNKIASFTLALDTKPLIKAKAKGKIGESLSFKAMIQTPFDDVTKARAELAIKIKPHN